MLMVALQACGLSLSLSILLTNGVALAYSTLTVAIHLADLLQLLCANVTILYNGPAILLLMGIRASRSPTQNNSATLKVNLLLW